MITILTRYINFVELAWLSIFRKYFWRLQRVTIIEKGLINIVSKILKPMIIDSPKRMIYLDVMQSNGYNALPERYWEPIPLVADIDKNTVKPRLVIDELSETEIHRDIEKIINSEEHVAEFRDFIKPIEDNHMFKGLDALVYRYLIQKYSPKNIIEIGAGFSSYVALNSVKDTCTITAIEPYPSEFLINLEKNNKPRLNLISKPVQDIDFNIFNQLEENDILFIDSTHVCFIGGDLPAIFLRILPRIKHGVIIHFHDVSLPYEYPRSLVFNSGRMYNELYMVASLLVNGPYSYIWGSYPFLLKRNLWLNNASDNYFKSGLSVWIRKTKHS